MWQEKAQTEQDLARFCGVLRDLRFSGSPLLRTGNFLLEPFLDAWPGCRRLPHCFAVRYGLLPGLRQLFSGLGYVVEPVVPHGQRFISFHYLRMDPIFIMTTTMTFSGRLDQIHVSNHIHVFFPLEIFFDFLQDPWEKNVFSEKGEIHV